MGGLMTPADVRAMLDAGADLVQIHTGLIYNGPGFVRDICRELLSYDGELSAMRAAEASMREEAAAAMPSADPGRTPGDDLSSSEPS